MTHIESLRNTILQQSQPIGTKQRFGLFSQPLPIAVGDDGEYKKKLHPRNPQGKPLTQPRNIQIHPNNTGQVNSSFFQPLASLAASKIPDPYIDPPRRVLLTQRQAFLKGAKHQLSFIPSSGRKTLANSSYQYIQQKSPRIDPRLHRNSEGKVIIQNRNIFTNPMQTVDKNYFKFPKHMQEPYNRQHELENVKLIQVSNKKNRPNQNKNNKPLNQWFIRQELSIRLCKYMAKTQNYRKYLQLKLDLTYTNMNYHLNQLTQARKVYMDILLPFLIINKIHQKKESETKVHKVKKKNSNLRKWQHKYRPLHLPSVQIQST